MLYAHAKCACTLTWAQTHAHDMLSLFMWSGLKLIHLFVSWNYSAQSQVVGFKWSSAAVSFIIQRPQADSRGWGVFVFLNRDDGVLMIGWNSRQHNPKQHHAESRKWWEWPRVPRVVKLLVHEPEGLYSDWSFTFVWDPLYGGLSCDHLSQSFLQPFVDRCRGPSIIPWPSTTRDIWSLRSSK